MKHLLSFAFLATAAVAPGQVLHPDVRDRATEPPPRSDDTVIQRQPEQQKPAASPFGSELPFFDPSGETVSWNGHTWAATDNRLVSARFERYLNQPEDSSEQAVAYRETIQKILELVSPHHAGGPDFPAALKLLPKASTYPGDAKLCDSLSQAIYAAVLSKKDVRMTKQILDSLESEKKRLIHNADVIAEGTELGSTQPTGGGGGGRGGQGGGQGQTRGGAQPKPGTGTESIEYKEAVRRVVEIEAMRKANQAKGEVQLLQAKMQYQALILQFFLQRRFEHVLMAARFYHQIFNDGDNRLHIDKKSDISKLFSESLGTSPTVSVLDSLASEAIRDVDQGVEAFNFLVEKQEYQSAAKRLSEAYMVGEFMPSIGTLPRDQKRKVLEFVRESYRLLAALEAKDYTLAGELTKKLKAMSGDFDATKAEAAVATYTRVSSMHIDAAKLAASKGDNEKASIEIKNAMEVWPQNPKLAEFDKLVEAGGGLAMAKNDFDRLLSEQNYREIFRRQYEIAPAIAGDPGREDAFKQIVANLTRIETALGKAAEFSKMDQHVAAWEQLASLRKEFPDDPKLGAELEKLAPEVADFTKALNNARDFEQRRDKQVGAALSWYLKARSIYPRSEMAEAGIQRMLAEILPDSRAESEPKRRSESRTSSRYDDAEN
jgi:hypothetical protein